MKTVISLQHIAGVHPHQFPDKADFDARDECLDAIRAWKHFGGLTFEKAYTVFCKRPDIYQEDFMFMGWKAFGYYFPIIEKYLYEVELQEEGEDSNAWILARAILGQMKLPELKQLGDLRERVLRLCLHVKSDLHQYASEPKEQMEIGEAWAELESFLEANA